MTITLKMMKAAASTGLSVVCASCELYWEARNKGIQGDVCLSQNRCGSPFVGGNFSEYRGSMTADAFKSFCFVCGDDAVKSVQKRGMGRMLGLCVKHFEWLSDPTVRGPQLVTATTKPKRNFLGVDEATLKGLKLPPEQSLLGQMLKTEKEWADEDGVEFKPHALMGANGSNGKRS